MRARFARFAQIAADAAGAPWAFLLALVAVVAWFVAGLLLGFTDTMQLVINTATTIVTFLLVFLIQSAQNRQDVALHTKLDELIRALDAADNRLIGIERHAEEGCDDGDLEEAE